jgi:hypothetical protein
MAHRRLLTVMLFLLVGLLVASVLAPPPERRGAAGSQTQTTTPATTATQATPPGDERPERSPVPAGVDGVLPRDRTVSARPGQVIDLRVTATRAVTIEIPSLGALAPASPGTPAQFIVAFDRSGRYAVRDLDSGEDVGAVIVD